MGRLRRPLVQKWLRELLSAGTFPTYRLVRVHVKLHSRYMCRLIETLNNLAHVWRRCGRSKISLEHFFKNLF